MKLISKITGSDFTEVSATLANGTTAIIRPDVTKAADRTLLRAVEAADVAANSPECIGMLQADDWRICNP